MITIIGAGMAGLLAANMLRNHSPKIMEAQGDLPNNHEALLRFRSDACAKATGIPFKAVKVHKAIKYGDIFLSETPPSLANMYSLKVTGEVHSRSIWDLAPVTRYIAPRDFVAQMARGLTINYAKPFQGLRALRRSDSEPVISTIPMPALMKIVGWKDVPDFNHKPIFAYNAEITSPQVDVYQTIYYPDIGLPFYRASLCGRYLTIEFIDEPEQEEIQRALEEVLEDFGLGSPLDNVIFFSDGKAKRHEYGKIVPCDDEARKDFIYTMSREYNIYSLGRFATWRQLLLDDVVDDIKIIEKLIASEGKRQDYHRALQAIHHTSSLS
jgi:hypothetical protein